MSDPYDPIELRPTAAGCSALFFALPVVYTVIAPLMVRAWGFRVVRYGLLLLPIASLAGLIAGLVAMRRGRTAFVLVVTALNAAIFLSCVAAVVLVILR